MKFILYYTPILIGQSYKNLFLFQTAPPIFIGNTFKHTKKINFEIIKSDKNMKLG